jgi:hypothetical protein
MEQNIIYLRFKKSLGGTMSLYLYLLQVWDTRKDKPALTLFSSQELPPG